MGAAFCFYPNTNNFCANIHLSGDNVLQSARGMDVHVKFGWFFRIFISQRIYRNTIDWRLERFVTNLKLMAEGKQPTDAYWQQIDKEKNKYKSGTDGNSVSFSKEVWV